jgi:hypothetical protein
MSKLDPLRIIGVRVGWTELVKTLIICKTGVNNWAHSLFGSLNFKLAYTDLNRELIV